MLDVHALRRRAVESVQAHQSTIVAFVVAALGFILAGILLFTPALAQTTAPTTLLRGLARGLAIAFGPSAVLLCLIAGAHALTHLMERGLEFHPARILNSLALVISIPCIFALMDGSRGHQILPGGVIGLLARDAATAIFPVWFALPLFLAMAIFSLILSTDWLFYGLRSNAVAAPPRRKKKKRKKKPPPPEPVVVEEPEPVAQEEEEEEDDDWYEADVEDEEEDEEEYEDEDEEEEYEDDEEEEEYEEEEEEEEEEPVKPAPRVPVAVAPGLPDLPRPKRGKDTTPLPGIELLEKPKPIDVGRIEKAIETNAEVLERTLASFRIETRVVGYTRGPVITMYELALKEGTKLSTIVNRADDLAIALKAESVRIVAPIPGKNTVGVEVPNVITDDVRLYGLIDECGTDQRSKAIPLFLGRDAAGNQMVEDLATMPHLLIAGATGSGKSVCINSIIVSILMSRRVDEVRLILVDPKQVELAFFKDIPHLLTSVVTDPRKAAQTLDWVVTEMEDRYRIFALFGVRNIAAYNRLGAKRVAELAKQHDIGESSAPAHMPYLVVVVDELADLIMTGRKEVEHAITRLAQKSRAVGIHTVLATQRPSTDVITGLIKANMPSRASFKVTSKVDSRVVLDRVGAEKLLGRGDMLLLPPRSFHLVRAQGCYVSDAEVRDVVSFLRENGPGQDLRELIVRPETIDERDPREVDAMFDTACRVVLESQRGSASLLQRALSVGYTRASRLIDLMRAQGIIGEFRNAQAAEVLMTLEEYEAKYNAEEE